MGTVIFVELHILIFSADFDSLLLQLFLIEQWIYPIEIIHSLHLQVHFQVETMSPFDSDHQSAYEVSWSLLNLRNTPSTLYFVLPLFKNNELRLDIEVAH